MTKSLNLMYFSSTTSNNKRITEYQIFKNRIKHHLFKHIQYVLLCKRWSQYRK